MGSAGVWVELADEQRIAEWACVCVCTQEQQMSWSLISVND